MFGWAVDDVLVFQPSGFDASLNSIDVPSEVNLGETITIEGTISNAGLETISSLEIAWSIGEENFLAEFDGLDLESGASYSFTHPDELIVDAMGSLELSISIISVNGGEDDNDSNNLSLI